MLDIFTNTENLLIYYPSLALPVDGERTFPSVHGGIKGGESLRSLLNIA